MTERELGMYCLGLRSGLVGQVHLEGDNANEMAVRFIEHLFPKRMPSQAVMDALTSEWRQLEPALLREASEAHKKD